MEPDTDLKNQADAIRQQLTQALLPVLDAINEFSKVGWNVGFAIGGVPVAIEKIDVSKKF